MPARLRPSAPIASDAVLTGDPARAMMLAQELTTRPKMSNHARGLWGYWGVREDGRELTVQSTGTGGPSAALVLRDLAELGLKRAVRVGTCVSADPGLDLGALLIVTEALAEDGVSRSHGKQGASLSGQLTDAVIAAGEGVETAVAASFDVLPAPERIEAAGARVADMQTAALFSVAPDLGVEVGALLVVSEDAAGERIGDELLEDSAKRAGRVAAAALSP